MLALSTMAKRSYRQNCALARAADVIGERWTLLLVRDLLIGPRRFRDLVRSLKGIGTNLLTSRLRELQAAGLIERRGQQGYALTSSGAALEPAVLALVRWGLAYGPPNHPGDYHEDEWDLVALKALFQPQRAGDLDLRVQFDSAEVEGWMRIDSGSVSIGAGRLDSPDLVIGGTIAELFTGELAAESLLSSGNAQDLQRFMKAFALKLRASATLS